MDFKIPRNISQDKEKLLVTMILQYEKGRKEPRLTQQQDNTK